METDGKMNTDQEKTISETQEVIKDRKTKEATIINIPQSMNLNSFTDQSLYHRKLIKVIESYELIKYDKHSSKLIKMIDDILFSMQIKDHAKPWSMKELMATNTGHNTNPTVILPFKIIAREATTEELDQA